MADPKQLEVLWCHKLGIAVSKWDCFARPTPAVGGDGSIYFPVENFLYAFTPGGQQKWKLSKEPRLLYMDVATGSNGTVYLASGALYALGTDGSVKWKIPSAWGLVSSVALSERGRLYFNRDDALCAADLSGKIIWERKMHGFASLGPVIGPDGTIYAGEFKGSRSDPRIHAFTPDGTLKWTFEIGPASLSVPSISDTGTLYFGGDSGNLYALGPNGKLRWTFKTDRGIVSTPAVGPDGTIYCGCADGALYAVNSDGGLRWKFQTKAPVSSSPAIDADGNVYFTSGHPSGDHNLYSVDSTGSVKGILALESGCGSPVVGPDAIIYLVDLDYVYAIRAFAGPSAGPWPMKRHDAQGTGRASKGEIGSY